MKQPRTFSEAPWGQSWIELVVLYVLTTVAIGMLFELPWTMAMVAAPVGMLGILVGVMASVQTLWMLTVGLEKVGTAVGLRKSPLI